ncbi:TPA: preprotein translocase subunit SecE [Streptococcus suis]|uniref:Preprotein translocase subunit SecE n=1 Tax=Streptococcus iners TaxID=3028084 RepID=A0AA97A4P5_9STRE|nr:MULTISPECIES: preprotein translocase subunit SecE [Streptococcus]MCK3904870.1 preprotein translocase subunit SecE [Streptococcus suis]MCK3942384.1 preprotein translocase subunit SecE [Streptococcus suis]MCK4025008.1 preprotein translocase subunit SecE [Streptococcus suis]NQI71374.1 preprotein translocase subunit SecE [Streptococcus suis]NQJ70317.1 preprotein translocase subunit SecE [Streptococcus suis]
MKFLKDIFQILKKTAWPTRKQSWKDFASVVQYTAFFVAIVYLFDLILSRGIMSLINLF